MNLRNMCKYTDKYNITVFIKSDVYVENGTQLKERDSVLCVSERRDGKEGYGRTVSAHCALGIRHYKSTKFVKTKRVFIARNLCTTYIQKLIRHD